MAQEPARQFIYAGTAAQAYEFIEHIRNTLPDHLDKLKIHDQSGRSVQPKWKIFLPGKTGQAGIEAYEQNKSKTEIWFFDSYRTYDQPMGQPFADLVDHILAEHERVAGPGQE